MAARLSPVGALARAADYDRYLSALFAPAVSREALFALIAFNHEIARIPEAVSEPMLGRIRLQWWRETLEAIQAGAPARRHEVALPLADAIHAWGLDRAPFDELLDGREADLEPKTPPGLAGLERYAAATGGALTALMLQASGADGAPALAAGRQVGTAWALIGTLRAAPLYAAQGRVMLPADLLAAAGITAEEFLAGRGFAHSAAAAEPVARRAEELLRAARRARRAVPRRRRGVLLIARLADVYLARLRAAAWDPRDERLAVGPLRKQVAMLAGAIVGRY